VFYDGSYFTYAQRYFYHHRKIGWIEFRNFHSLLENYLRTKEQGYTIYKIVYAAWFQGMFPSGQSSEHQLRVDRNVYHDLMHAGIDPKYLPTSQSGQGEKGTDVALAIDALQIGLEGHVDIVVLVSGDGDLVPLVRALMKRGIRVMCAYFEYNEGDQKSFINDRLLSICNYDININQLEHDKHFKAAFKTLFFRKIESHAKPEGTISPERASLTEKPPSSTLPGGAQVISEEQVSYPAWPEDAKPSVEE
jgi:hypothetical protein